MEFKKVKFYFSWFRYAYLHGYDKKRVYQILFSFFSTIGFIWTLIECFAWLFDNSENSYPDQLKAFISTNINIIGAGLLLLSIYLNRKRIRLSQTFTNTDLTIIVEFCDLFEKDGATVIPVMDTFDNDGSNNLVNPRSIHGQFITKYFPNNLQSLDIEISTFLASRGFNPIQNDPTLKGKKDRYEIGTTCSVTAHNKYFYLSALSSMTSTGNVDIQPQYINQFLVALWNFIPNHGVYYDIVNIPVVGTGLNRLPASYTREYILREIAHSFFLISKQRQFCKTLRICLNISDYKYYNLDDIEVIFTHIDKYLNR